MTDPVFWIWLQEALGAGSIKADRVIREIGSPEALYKQSKSELIQTGIFAPKEIERLKSTDLTRAEENLRRARKCGCTVITPDHPDYPENLTNIDCMPCVLYVVGSLADISRALVLTMVGTRKSDDYGETAAERLSFDLATAGCVVASGLAVGIDYASHEGALRAGGRSVGLLACGMDVDYPSASNTLKRRILDRGGVLMTEFPFGETAHRYNFNIRNRILSGIAAGVVVVQAPEQSGALNTARHALEQNREVFAVPGGIFDEKMTGCNRLIRDGAKIVVNVYSILEEYIHKFPDTIDAKSIVPKIKSAAQTPRPEGLPDIPRRVVRRKDGDEPREFLMVAQETAEPPVRLAPPALAGLGLSPAAIRIYGLLGRQPSDCEWLAAEAGLTAMALMGALTELELSGLAGVLPGKRYILVEGAAEPTAPQADKRARGAL